MKRTFAAVLLGTALSLTACGGSGEPAPRETVYVQQDEQDNSSSPSSVEDDFLNIVARNMTPALHDVSQQDVLDVGYTICEATSDGESPEDITYTGLEAGINADDFGAIIGAAVTTLCPEHEEEWTEFFDSIGDSNA